MHSSLFLVILAGVAQGRPQGVTQAIAPPGQTAPVGCSPSHEGSFAMVMVPAIGISRREANAPPHASQLTDGQVQVPTLASNSKSTPKPSHTPARSATKSGSAPHSPTSNSSNSTASSSEAVSPSSKPSTPGYGPSSLSSEPTASTSASISLPSPASESSASHYQPVTQGPVTAASEYTSPVFVTQISDGQVQAPSVSWSATTSTLTASMVYNPITMISDGQIQAAPTPLTSVSMIYYITSVPVAFPPSPSSSSNSTVSFEAPSSYPTLTGRSFRLKDECRSPDTLEMTLANSVLTDSKGRTGYIADNRQFQFDAPAQAGALYNAGWSMCSDGRLALGSQTVFYQCRSGDFYNLYDRNWAAQCEPVYFQTYALSDC